MYVKIDVNSPANDASFTGTVDFDLQYTEEDNITETLGIAKVGDIVERGEYPQTFVGKDLNVTLVALQKTGTLDETGRTFTTYMGASYDSHTQIICKEYLYNNERYVMVESANFNIYNVTFSTGESIGDTGKTFNDGDTVFFKVEPIRFRVMALDENNGTMTLWSDDVIGQMWFDDYSEGWFGYYSWQNSGIRSYLNNRFIKESYLGYAPKEVTIENNLEGEYYVNNGESTQDKLWLPAITDLIEWYPELNIQVKSSSYTVLCKKPTDFLLATYTHVDSYFKGYCSYWFRSMGNVNTNLCFVSWSSIGAVSDAENILNIDGFRPAFVTDL